MQPANLRAPASPRCSVASVMYGQCRYRVLDTPEGLEVQVKVVRTSFRPLMDRQGRYRECGQLLGTGSVGTEGINTSEGLAVHVQGL